MCDGENQNIKRIARGTMERRDGAFSHREVSHLKCEPVRGRERVVEHPRETNGREVAVAHEDLRDGTALLIGRIALHVRADHAKHAKVALGICTRAHARTMT